MCVGRRVVKPPSVMVRRGIRASRYQRRGIDWRTGDAFILGSKRQAEKTKDFTVVGGSVNKAGARDRTRSKVNLPRRDIRTGIGLNSIEINEIVGQNVKQIGRAHV